MSIIKFRNSDFHIQNNEFDNDGKGYKNTGNQRFDYNFKLQNFQS